MSKVFEAKGKEHAGGRETSSIWLAGLVGGTRKKETTQPHSFQSEVNSILSTTEYLFLLVNPLTLKYQEF